MASSPHGTAAAIKVVRVIARLNIGGPAIQAMLLSQRLPAEQYASLLVTGVVGEHEGDLTPEAHRRGIATLVIPELGREITLLSDLRAFFKLLRILRRVSPDIIHTHTAKAGFLGRLAALFARVPVKVHTYHGHVFFGYFGTWKTRLILLIERLLARFTDMLIVLSDGQREEFISRYRIADRTKFEVIPLGFDLDPFLLCPDREESRARVGIPSGTFVIGFIGRLVSIKNPYLLIRALELARLQMESRGTRSLPEFDNIVRALVVGGGELESELRRDVAVKELEKVVAFLGWRRDMPAIHAALDLVVLTSDNEGTPVALIEAMASGKPIISTEVGGVRDLMLGKGEPLLGEGEPKCIAYENGVLIPPGDPRALAAALLWFERNRDVARTMGDAGRSFAAKQFNANRLLEDVRALYGRLHSDPRAGVKAA